MASVTVSVQVVHVEARVAVAGVLGHQDRIGLAAQTAVHVALVAGEAGGVARLAVVVG